MWERATKIWVTASFRCSLCPAFRTCIQRKWQRKDEDVFLPLVSSNVLLTWPDYGPLSGLMQVNWLLQFTEYFFYHKVAQATSQPTNKLFLFSPSASQFN